MLHARIAARAFNTPLLVEPSKAMAFLSGLGPRVLGRRLDGVGDVDGFGDGGASTAAVLPASRGVLASVIAGDALAGHADSPALGRDAPYPVIDGIAVIEISGVLIHRGAWIGNASGQTSYEGLSAQLKTAASDPAVRGVALEIDSFGGEVAGVFDLADRIRALGRQKPIWAFVAEHAFSAGYALASQANRILLPRTGAVGSIGVVVMHTDLSSQLDQEGVRVTLVHAGRHKVDANPYEPLAPEVRDGIQREIEGLRFLFAETVAAGRGGRLSEEAALATEAATFRGTEAVAAGLADEVIDLASGFAAFRQHVARTSATRPGLGASTTRGTGSPRSQSAAQASHPSPSSPSLSGKDPNMDPEHDPDDSTNAADDQGASPAPASLSQPSPSQATGPSNTALVAATAMGPTSGAASRPALPEAATASPRAAPERSVPAPSPEALASLSAQLRESAAEIAEIAAQAARLGVSVDMAAALREGTTPAALRRLVLDRAAAAADARDIVAAPPSPVRPQATESPIVAAAKRAADAGRKA